MNIFKRMWKQKPMQVSIDEPKPHRSLDPDFKLINPDHSIAILNNMIDREKEKLNRSQERINEIQAKLNIINSLSPETKTLLKILYEANNTEDAKYLTDFDKCVHDITYANKLKKELS